MDDIINRHPVNKQSAIVTSQGECYTPNKKIQTSDSDTPLKTAPLPQKPGRNFLDLTGVRRGRLTVIGLSADQNNRWVARCDCGTYTLRTARAIKNPANTQDRCEHCRHLAFLKREEFYRRTGKNRDIKDF